MPLEFLFVQLGVSRKTNSVGRILSRILFSLMFETLFWSVGNVISVPVWLSRTKNQRERYCLNFVTSISASIDTIKMTNEIHPVDYRGQIRRMEFGLFCRGIGAAKFYMTCARKTI